MKRVTGFGGLFFKANDHKALCAWYERHLGIPLGAHGYASFIWAEGNNGAQTAQTAFSIMPSNSDYFAPSKGTFMLNFRVHDLDALVAALHTEGVALVCQPETHSYGKFAWLLDPEGNKIKLWESLDGGF